ncbi:MAG: leucine-rich repeat domain-containing protein, partial [Clostridiales bacterium]|nr:leucine-rich repeat domain-containing protein [Clostridiales bacterium]
MGIKAEGKGALQLLELLDKMDKWYVPTEEEQAYLESVEELWFSVKASYSEAGMHSDRKPFPGDDGMRFLAVSNDVLPNSVDVLTNLRKLDLSGAKITALPESIGNLTNLQELSLSNTQISTLPSSIGNLTNLQKLSLSDTQISTLPESIGNLSNLQSLDLSGTQISTLPDFIGNCSFYKSEAEYDTQLVAL